VTNIIMKRKKKTWNTKSNPYTTHWKV